MVFGNRPLAIREADWPVHLIEKTSNEENNVLIQENNTFLSSQ